MKDPGHPPTLVRKPEQIESMYELPRRIDAPEYADEPHPDQQQPQVAPALQCPQYVHTSEKEHQKARDLAPRLHGVYRIDGSDHHWQPDTQEQHQQQA